MEAPFWLRPMAVFGKRSSSNVHSNGSYRFEHSKKDGYHAFPTPATRWPRKHRSNDSSSPFPRPDQVYRLTVEQYDQMIRDRILLEDEAVKLLNGVLVTKMPKNPRHRVATRKTVRALEKVLPAGWIVQKEEAIVIPSGSKLEPDVAIIRSELEFDVCGRTGHRLLSGRRGCRHQFPGPVRETSSVRWRRASRSIGL